MITMAMELQNNKSMETRYFNIEYKSLDNNEIQGTASSLNSPYDMGGFDEVIGGFDEVIGGFAEFTGGGGGCLLLSFVFGLLLSFV